MLRAANIPSSFLNTVSFLILESLLQDLIKPRPFPFRAYDSQNGNFEVDPQLATCHPSQIATIIDNNQTRTLVQSKNDSRMNVKHTL